MHDAVISRKKRQTVATGLSDGNPVSTWLDSSGRGNHATMTGSNRPTFKTSVINGNPVVRFTSAGLSKLNLTTPISGVAAWYVFAVMKHATLTDRLDSLDGNDAGQPRGPLITSGNTCFMFSRDGWMQSAAAMSTGFHVIEGIYVGSLAVQHFILVDGVSAGDGTLHASANSGNFSTIGYDSSGPTYCDGDIAEIIVFNGPLSATDRQNMEKYLGTKYGISVPSGVSTQPTAIGALVGWWKADSLITGVSDALFTRYTGNPVVSNGFGSPAVTQVQEFMPFVNPLDSTQMIALFSGVQGGLAHIFYATSPVSDGQTWTIGNGANPIISDISRRADSIVVDGTNIKFYGTNNPAGTPQGIDMLEQTFTGLAGLASGWTLHSNVLSHTGSETDVSQGAVLKDGSTYYMYYSYRTASATLPGIRVASSPDGITWTRQNGGADIISRGAAGTYDATYFEFHQIQKLGSTYVITCEVYGGPEGSADGSVWHEAMYYSSSPTSGWSRSTSNPVFSGSRVTGSPDRYHVATPYWAFINGAWRLFYQASNTDPFTTYYEVATWTVCGATLKQGLDPTSLLT